jgi:molybdopterin converting factor subunit 1
VRVVLFGPVRDIVGCSELSLDVGEPFTGNAAFETLAGRYPALRSWKGSTRFAVNREYAPFEQTVRSGDEVSFIPPVSGG